MRLNISSVSFGPEEAEWERHLRARGGLSATGDGDQGFGALGKWRQGLPPIAPTFGPRVAAFLPVDSEGPARWGQGYPPGSYLPPCYFKLKSPWQCQEAAFVPCIHECVCVFVCL